MPGGSEGQGWVFLICAGFGLLIGVVYDADFILRTLCRRSVAAGIVIDIAFFLCAAGIVIWGLGVADYGTVRLYSLSAFAAGFGVERVTLGQIIKRFITLIEAALRKAAAHIKARLDKYITKYRRKRAAPCRRPRGKGKASGHD